MSDFIRKSEAIKVIMEDDVCCYCSHTRVLREIKKLPTIEPNGVQKALCEQAYKEGQLSKMPKRGEWIDKDGGLATCSVCGDRWGVWSVMNYCPSCGARMKGANDD